MEKTSQPYAERVIRCTGLMKEARLDVLLLAKPANMAYLTGIPRCYRNFPRLRGVG